MASGALSSLFVHVSDCAPGCGCGAALFVEDPERVEQWVRDDGCEDARTALRELERLASSPIDVDALGRAIGRRFGGADEARTWLLRWADLVRDALARAEAMPEG